VTPFEVHIGTVHAWFRVQGVGIRVQDAGSAQHQRAFEYGREEVHINTVYACVCVQGSGIVQVTVPRVSRSCQHFLDGFEI